MVKASTPTTHALAPTAASISLSPAVSETMRCGAFAGIVIGVPCASVEMSGFWAVGAPVGLLAEVAQPVATSDRQAMRMSRMIVKDWRMGGSFALRMR